jgi:hypothetical protein
MNLLYLHAALNLALVLAAGFLGETQSHPLPTESVLPAKSAHPAAPTPPAPAIDVLNLTAVPAGHYLVNLQAHGPERWLNFKVAGPTAVCVQASDPDLRGLRGTFQTVGNGVFLISFGNAAYHGTQFWVFRSDGTARVAEIPDRGEQQEARPVPDDRVSPPATEPAATPHP